VRPRRRWGQNFVVDPNTIARVVRVAGPLTGEVVCEVGPGLGSLTGALLAAGARVVAVEVDPVLAAGLPGLLTGHPGAGALRVVSADAVRVDPGELHVGGVPATRLVANLPYNAATPIAVHLLRGCPGLTSGVVMVQAEMAARWSAGPGDPAYGSPSVKLAWDVRVERIGPVPRSAFWPVPEVDSTLVSLTRVPPPGPPELREPTFTVIEAAFAQRRKTLRRALSGLAGGPAAAEQWLVTAGIDPALRGEALTVAEFLALARCRPGLVSPG